MATILVIDDHAYNRKYLAALLKPFGHKVLEAEDGREGLALAVSHQPDVIISDVYMPTMDGVEFVEQLRRHPVVGNRPVLFSSATYGQRHVEELARRCGVSWVIPKPCDPEIALAIIRQALGEADEAMVESRKPEAPDQARLAPEEATLATLLSLGVELQADPVLARSLDLLCRAARTMLQAECVVLVENRGPASQVILAVAGDLEGAELAPGRLLERGEPLVPGLPAEQWVDIPIPGQADVRGYLSVLRSRLATPVTLNSLDTLGRLLAILVSSVMERFDLQAARTRAEAELQAHRARLEHVLEVQDLALYTASMGLNMPVSWMSATIRRISGFDPERYYEEAFWASRIHPGDRERVLAALGRLKSGEKVQLRYRWQSPDGSYRWYLDQASATREKPGKTLTIVGCRLEIHEQVQREEQLIQAGALDAIGRLAAGIAHDFNTLLAVIALCSSQLRRLIPDDSPGRQEVEDIAVAADRGATLISRLLAIGRPVIGEGEPLELGEAVEAALATISPLLGKKTRVRFVNEGAPWMTVASAVLVGQIAMNLVLNAQDAMPAGGPVEVSVRKVDAGELPDLPGLSRIDHLCLSVSDKGVGIPAEDLERIFDPFLTTKQGGVESGLGLGLGLATVATITRQLGGAVRAVSEPGAGSEFDVFLPRYFGGAPAADSPGESS